MKLDAKKILQKLGAGESIESVCHAAEISREEFDRWWAAEAASRVPEMSGLRNVPVKARVEIERDTWGIPHIFASNDEDLLFGFGYAMAQDRLFQLEYLRRKAWGRLAEILGPEGVESDTIVRTVGIPAIARSEENSLPQEARVFLKAFTAGINAAIDDSRDRLPIEFDLLDFEPGTWTPQDCLAIQAEFAWYLTGRFPVIVIPELARRVLGEGPLFQAFLQGEADDECILPSGSYPQDRVGCEPIGAVVGDPDGGKGSNNWVVSGARTVTGKPMLASDPHIAFAAVSCWYEVHLCGEMFNVIGTAYVGMPAVIFGRNERVAWGITNNICSLRDLYQERTDPAHPGCFLYNGKWEPAQERIEEIKVKGAPTLQKSIRLSRNGPIVDEILPLPARTSGPVSLRWMGSAYSGWLAAMQRMNRAKSAAQFRETLKSWKVPTWSVVFADADGHIGYQAVGQIPIRNKSERGYRPGWDPVHQWEGLIPSEGMPGILDPYQGWIATANNRPAPNDYPYPLSGTWSSGHRARRIRQMIEEKDSLSPADFVRMQQDVLSLRAEECVPRLLRILARHKTQSPAGAVQFLQSWNLRMEVDSIGATLFDVFFAHWSRVVVSERFSGELVELFVGAIGGLAADLLDEDSVGWFEEGTRDAAVLKAFEATIEELSSRLGNNVSSWTWGNVHRIVLRHVLSGKGDLGKLLDRGGLPVSGNGVTVCNTGYDPNWGAPTGANYRLIVDLSDSPPRLRAVDAQGQSGHPGSAHYCDQLGDWMSGHYHYLSLNGHEAPYGSKLTLEPIEK